MDFEDATSHAFGIESRLLASSRRTGWPVVGKLEDSHQILALFEFDSGQVGLFDFTWNQYWSWVRVPRVLILGTRGEIVQDRIAWLRDSQTPMSLPLERVHGGFLGFRVLPPRDSGRRRVGISQSNVCGTTEPALAGAAKPQDQRNRSEARPCGSAAFGSPYPDSICHRWFRGTGCPGPRWPAGCVGDGDDRAWEMPPSPRRQNPAGRVVQLSSRHSVGNRDRCPRFDPTGTSTPSRCLFQKLFIPIVTGHRNNEENS